MNAPQRLQLSRKRGYRLQSTSKALNGLDAVNCARPGRWGNPFRVGREGATFAVARFCVMLKAGATTGWSLAEIRTELGGKNLACWCDHGEPCHADALLLIANGDRSLADFFEEFMLRI